MGAYRKAPNASGAPVTYLSWVGREIKTGRKAITADRDHGKAILSWQPTKKRSSQTDPEQERAWSCSNENTGVSGKAIERSSRGMIEKQQNQKSYIVWWLWTYIHTHDVEPTQPKSLRGYEFEGRFCRTQKRRYLGRRSEWIWEIQSFNLTLSNLWKDCSSDTGLIPTILVRYCWDFSGLFWIPTPFSTFLAKYCLLFPSSYHVYNSSCFNLRYHVGHESHCIDAA
jgi:hypothetical protein